MEEYQRLCDRRSELTEKIEEMKQEREELTRLIYEMERGTPDD